MRPPQRVLIAGVSVRGVAESAARAGYAVTAIDAFTDRDLVAIAAEVYGVRPYTARAAARIAGTLGTADLPSVAYVSNFENRPSALRQLVGDRVLLGNRAPTLAGARDPATVVAALSAAGLPAARVRHDAPRLGSADAVVRWLLKPRASGGGHGIAPWRRGVRVPRTHVLQRRIPGHPASVLIAADGAVCIVLGVTRQLIGDRRFGARPFRYCGNLLGPPDDPDWGAQSTLAVQGAAIGSAMTRAFGLVGVNGVDVIVGKGSVTAIEVNPRYTAAMELVERRDGTSIFGAHVAGCTGQLGTLRPPRPQGAAVGKAILFARRPLVLGATDHWLADPEVRDVPSSGATIALGAPICTIFAAASTMRDCYARLVERAANLYTEVERRGASGSGPSPRSGRRSGLRV